jgi:hypothetical protein
MLDCLRPVLDALGLDEQHEAGRFLVALDALLDEARIPEALIIQHMGHTNERARGDSRLRDWPDAEWRLVRRDEKDEASDRFIVAYGRDVEVPESQLVFNPATRHLTIEDGSRHEARTREALDDLLAFLRRTGNTEQSGRMLKAELEGDHPRDVVDDALRLGVRRGVLSYRDGPKNSKLYRAAAVGVSGVSGSVRPRTPDTAE